MSTTPSPTPTSKPTYYDAAREHEFSAANTLLLVIVMMFAIGIGLIMKKYHNIFRFFPESAMEILIGIVAGAFVRAVYPQDQRPVLDFKPELFFFVLLPLIIFDAGYTLKKKRFFSNFGTILLYAVVGTLISSLIVGLLTFAFAQIGWIQIEKESPLQALMFGSLISSIDPVATLSIMGDPSMNIDPLLYSLVFGESVLNDVVAIVLFRVLLEYVEEEHASTSVSPSFGFSQLGNVFLQFIAILLGSVLIGIACGLLCSFIFKRTSIPKYYNIEIQLLFLTAFGCFALSELLFMSGVMSIFFCAVTLSHYNFHNLSTPSKITSVHISETLASSAETVVMIYIGMSMFSSYTHWDAGFIALGMIFCFISRACNIFPLSFLANLCRTRKIPWNMQFVIFFGGLRGAVSYALSMQLAGSGSEKSVEIVQTTTLMIIILTTVLLGGATEPMLRIFKMQNSSNHSNTVTPSSSSNDNQLREDFIGRSFREHNGNDSGGDRNGNSHTVITDNAEDDDEDDVNMILGNAGGGSGGSNTAALKSWARLDILYLRPIFGGRRPRHFFERAETQMNDQIAVEELPSRNETSPRLIPVQYTALGDRPANSIRYDDNPFSSDSEARL